MKVKTKLRMERWRNGRNHEWKDKWKDEYKDGRMKGKSDGQFKLGMDE